MRIEIKSEGCELSLNKKNLTFIVAHLKSGGQENVAARLTYLMRHDYNVKVILLDDRDMNYELDCEYRCINIHSTAKPINKIINAIRRIIHVRKIKKEWKTDICLSFGATCDYINAFSKRRDHIYLSIRGYRGLDSPSRLAKIKNNIIYTKAHGVLCVSKRIVKRARELYPEHSEKFMLLYNPYDIKQIDVLKNKKLECYNSLFANNKVIIAAGTYRYEKGYWHLVKAFSLVKKNIPNVKLFIIGGYSDSKTKLTKLVSDLSLTEDVVLADFDSNPYKYMGKSSLYVLSSVFEGFPNVLAEAMACGVSIVAADCTSGPREILSEGNPFSVARDIEYQDYGLLVPPMTMKENYCSLQIEECDMTLARAIELYLCDDDMLNDYANKAVVGVERFSERICALNLKNIIET